MEAHHSAPVSNTPASVQIVTGRQNSPSSAKRLFWVDYARGMAILLVVYRHTMVGLNRAGHIVPDFMYGIQEFTVNFRMPVFFMLSGIFLSASLQKYAVYELVKKKAMTLLYPYLLWAVILISIQILLAKFTNSERTAKDYLYIITQPRELDHMWYLLALFNTSVLFLSVWRWLRHYPFVHVTIALALHLSSFLIKDYSLFSDLCYYYIFLVTGFLISKPLLTLEAKNSAFFGKALLLVLPFFIFGQFLWFTFQPENLALTIPFLCIIGLACSFFYLLCRFLQTIGFAPWLAKVGKMSLYIYILHILVISSFRIFSLQILGITNIYFLVGGSLILGVLLPVLAYRALVRWRIYYIFSLEKPKPAVKIK